MNWGDFRRLLADFLSQHLCIIMPKLGRHWISYFFSCSYIWWLLCALSLLKKSRDDRFAAEVFPRCAGINLGKMLTFLIDEFLSFPWYLFSIFQKVAYRSCRFSANKVISMTACPRYFIELLIWSRRIGTEPLVISSSAYLYRQLSDAAVPRIYATRVFRFLIYCSCRLFFALLFNLITWELHITRPQQRSRKFAITGHTHNVSNFRIDLIFVDIISLRIARYVSYIASNQLLDVDILHRWFYFISEYAAI